MNNVKPFTSQNVGPGLNQGYGTEPTGGFQQDTRQFELPKNIDEYQIFEKKRENGAQRQHINVAFVPHAKNVGNRNFATVKHKRHSPPP